MDYLSLTNNIYEIMGDCNDEVIEVICKRIKSLKELTAEDAQKLVNISRQKDIKNVSDIISQKTGLTASELETTFSKVIKNSDDFAKSLFSAKSLPPQTVENNVILKSIYNSAKKNSTDNLFKISANSVFEINHKTMSIEKAYNYATNHAIMAIKSGYSDYNSAIASTVKKIADSGVRVREGTKGEKIVKYASGYTKRIDSAVRENVMDALHTMSDDYRAEQGEMYRADLIFIDAHGMCAEDHLYIQGKSYTKKEYDALNSSLNRPIGEMNCSHSITFGINGISENPYTESDRQMFVNNSHKQVTYTGADGSDRTVTAYEMTQKQRNVETNIRKLKDEQKAFENAGNSTMAKKYEQKVKNKTEYYKKISEQAGVKIDKSRIS